MLTRDRLRTLLGQSAETPIAEGVTHGTEPVQGHALDRPILRIGQAEVPALYLRPAGPGPFPAVLYCHAHGNRYDTGAEELILGRPALLSPYGPTLADHGIASLAIDLAPFGARQGEGPEGALAQAALWQGRPLMGQMLADLQVAFGWLAARPDIDATRIATLGLSMGGTHAYWLAALEPGIAACAHLCVFADIAPLIAAGAHDLHGPYMTVPGLLAEGDMGDVAALVAPRPQLVCLGAEDPLTPESAREAALARLTAGYAGCPERLQVQVMPGCGHRETPEMRTAVLSFLARSLHR
jgi:dienelactone hydrolase